MYLLSTQCLLDRITGQAPASIDALPAREIHLSAVSLGQALLAIEQSPAGAVIPVSEATTMAVASALATNLVFVDYPQPYHSGVSGLTVVNP